MNYQLVEKPTGLTIVDELGAAVSFDEAHQVINQLMNTYAHPAYVYVACRAKLPNMEYKIGYSGQSPEARMSQLRYQEKDDRIILLHTIACKSSQSAIKLESEIHEWFEDDHIRGEWYSLDSGAVRFLLGVQSEDEANSKHLRYIVRSLIAIPTDVYSAWMDTLSDEEYDEHMALIIKIRDRINEILEADRLKQTKLPGF